MTTILSIILEEKKKEIIKLKKEMKAVSNYLYKKHCSLIGKLQESEKLAVIAEFKRASPSKGDINIQLDPQTQALAYCKFGADAISILTDTTFFRGSFEDLANVRKIVDIPILCKDFIIDESQILRAKIAGANIILLIVAALDESRLNELYCFAVKNGLEVIIEVHNEAEVEKAIATGTKLIGVNNRDLKSFSVDLSITEKLAPHILKSEAYLISESGIKTVEDINRVMAAGARGVLVGETLMNTPTLETVFRKMKRPFQEVTKS